MIKKIVLYFVSLTFIVLTFSGCATVFSGYEDRVDLVNASDNIKVYSKDSVELPVSSRTETKYSIVSHSFEVKEIKSINLRPNEKHILRLKADDKEKLVEVYPKILGTWLILDFITGIFPAFIDAYTGSWNFFPSINAEF